MPNDTAASQLLAAELDWLQQVISRRMECYFQNQPFSLDELPPPALDGATGEIHAATLAEGQLTPRDRLVLALALAPYLRPQLLDLFFTRNTSIDRAFTEFGGVPGKRHSGFLPTGETAAFLYAGDDLERRFALIQVFQPDHYLIRAGILQLDAGENPETWLSSGLSIAPEFLQQLATGHSQLPDFNARFPAKLIQTQLEWDDLVLAPGIRDEVDHLIHWMRNEARLMQDWGLAKHLKPGYRALFYGPPGTGKTLTATLLGKATGSAVYRIDLSMLVSKYIGETEKNLAGVFDQAANKRWILFFDEADSLFGQRTQTSNANDRHANQQVSYLLQRIEDFPGVVILASNLRANIDEAFSRRFQSAVYFPMPSAEERLQLWRGICSNKLPLDADVNLEQLAEDYTLAGGAIANAVRHAAVAALQHQPERIRMRDLQAGVIRELGKEGKRVA
ncbi:MAG: hypothetical protein RIR00_1771 [Pseudomonadota bacterium]